jgi:putative transposase
MARKPRFAPGGLVYHVLNRSAGRSILFRRDGDFEAFERLLVEAHRRVPLRLLSYCIMGNHWHFVTWPEKDGQLTEFFRWLAHTHAMRWRVAHNTVGYGHLYQGRFKSFPIQSDGHLSTACRYVERNPLTAGLVRRAQDWRWGSLWVRRHGPEELRSLLSAWPARDPGALSPDDPDEWEAFVNAPLTAKERERMELCLKRGQPLGDERWVRRTAACLRLEHTLRPEGRPRKHPLPQARQAKQAKKEKKEKSEPPGSPRAGAGRRR